MNISVTSPSTCVHVKPHVRLGQWFLKNCRRRSYSYFLHVNNRRSQSRLSIFFSIKTSCSFARHKQFPRNLSSNRIPNTVFYLLSRFHRAFWLIDVMPFLLFGYIKCFCNNLSKVLTNSPTLKKRPPWIFNANSARCSVVH